MSPTQVSSSALNIEQWQLLKPSHRFIFVPVIHLALLFNSCTQYHIALNPNRNAGLVTTLAAFVSLFLTLAFTLLNDSTLRVLTSFRLTKLKLLQHNSFLPIIISSRTLSIWMSPALWYISVANKVSNLRPSQASVPFPTSSSFGLKSGDLLMSLARQVSSWIIT